MSTLFMVPHQPLARKWRQEALLSGHTIDVFSVNGLVSHLLKEQGYPYRESTTLEIAALWDAVQESLDKIHYYAPLVKYPGFIQDLHSFFNRLSLKIMDISYLSEIELRELTLIYQKYQNKLSGLHLLDQAAQIHKAIEYWPKSQLYNKTERVVLYYLSDLAPLENKFIKTITNGKPNEYREFSKNKAVVSGTIFTNPNQEIDYVATRILELLNQGINPEAIAIASPNLNQYLPILVPSLANYRIPWQAPAVKLDEVPMGKGLLALIDVLQGNYTKEGLSHLVAIGWGMPFPLEHSERKALKLSPPSLRGFTAWERELGHLSGWKEIFDFLGSLAPPKGLYSIERYISGLLSVFVTFPLSSWPAKSPLEWAQLVKSYDGIQQILKDMAQIKQKHTFTQFNQIFRSMMSYHILPESLTFQQCVLVGSLNQILGMGYHRVFLVGMTESNFPVGIRREWLNRQVLPDISQSLYEQVLRSTDYLQLSYAREDLDGRVNIASPVFPESSTLINQQRPSFLTTKDIEIGNGLLDDIRIQRDIIRRCLGQPLSVSRLNFYARCPFSFLCSEYFDLREEEIKSEDISPLEEGALIHKVLRTFWQKEGGTPVRELLEYYYIEEGRQLTKRIINMVSTFCKKDVQLVETSGYLPKYLEYDFDGLEIQTQAGNILLRGTIDRIDIAPSGECVIYDYKTGGNPSVKEILNGEDLQLQVYLLAAEKLFPGKISGIGYYNVKSSSRTGLWQETKHRILGLTRRNSGIIPLENWDSLRDEFIETIKEYLERITSGYFPIKPVNQRVCLFCAFQGICRKEA